MHTFRAKPKHWVVTISLSIAVVALMTYAPTLLRSGPLRYAGLIIGPIFAGWIMREDILPLWRTHLVIDSQSLSGYSGGQRFEVSLGEVEAATIAQDSVNQYCLWLGTAPGVLSIPLKYLDVEQIQRGLQDRIGPAIYGEDAFEVWLEDQAYYEDLREAGAEFLQSVIVPLRAPRAGWMIVLGWFGLVFFGVLTVLFTIYQGFYPFSSIFIVFTLLSGLLVLPDIVEMDADKVTRIIPPFGRYQMVWDEVERIEFSSDFAWLVLYGKDKRLTTGGPSIWGRGREEVYDLLQAKVRQQGIEMRLNPWAQLIMFSKNTRVR